MSAARMVGSGGRQRLLVADAVIGASTSGSALLIKNGIVAAIGRPGNLRRPDLAEDRFAGAYIAPGLRDAHFHPVGYTTALNRLVVKRASSFDDLVRMVREAALEIAPGETLIGLRLDDEHLVERRLPTRHVLDAASTDHPIILYRYCGHVAVANTAALADAGVGPATADPFGGSFDRDEDGAPNGILRETAVAAVGDICGDRASGMTPSGVAAASRHLATMGLTSVGAMVTSGHGLWADATSELDLMLAAAPELAITMNTMVMTGDVDELERAKDRIDRAGRRMRFLGVKVITDGSLGGRTAAMDEGYSDMPDERGLLRVRRDETLDVARRSINLGGVVAIHAIGDAANAFTLDIFETLRDEGAPADSLRIEHASVLRETDIARIGDLGVVASIQPAFLASEQEWIAKRLGDRVERTYPFASLIAAGATLAGGSDCPVEPPHPLWGMSAAIDRGTISPSESLTGAQVFEAFTHGAAYSMREPEPLAIGSPADIVVLDHDPTTADPATIRNGTVLATFVEGEERQPEPGEAWKD